MNIVKQVMDELSGDLMGQLGSLLGTNAEKTERATAAAVPSLLSALARMMSNNDGAKKLTNVLGGPDNGGLDNIAQVLRGDASSLLNKGTTMLGSLLDDSMASGIANAVSRFAGLNAGVVRSLLAYLLPLVLGKVAAQWKSQGGTSQALTNLFADQRNQIASAVPAGFSLADIAGLTDARKAASSAGRSVKAQPVAARSFASWLLPLALVLLVGFLLWQFLLRPRVDQAAVETTAESVDEVITMKPVLPEATDVPGLARVSEDLGGLLRSLDTALFEIRDAASAERAMPALSDLNTKIDAMNQILSRLPEASRMALRPLIEDQVKVASEKAKAASSIEAIGAEIKALIQEIVTKITTWISPENN